MAPNPNTSVIVPHISHHQGTTLGNAFFKNERFRLESYAGFPNAFMDKGKLAAAGFYYTKTADVVRCAFCRLELGAWVPGDDPVEEHKKWACQSGKDCPFLSGREVGNMPINPSNPSESRGVDECGMYGINPVDPSVNVESLERLGVTRTVRALHVGFVNLQDRLKSFETWPMALQPRPEALAAAGFFYTGQGDRCVCYQCGGGLKDWSESDDPWVEHGKFFPLCTHVIVNKGQEFINSCRTTAPTNQSSVSTPTSNTAPSDNTAATNTTSNSSINTSHSTAPLSLQSPAVESTSGSTSNRPSEEEPSCSRIESSEPQVRSKEKSEEEEKPQGTVKCTKENTKEEKSEVLMCKICYQREMSVAFLGCGHVVACDKCASSLQHCAVCRREVEATLKVYLA